MKAARGCLEERQDMPQVIQHPKKTPKPKPKPKPRLKVVKVMTIILATKWKLKSNLWALQSETGRAKASREHGCINFSTIAMMEEAQNKQHSLYVASKLTIYQES